MILYFSFPKLNNDMAGFGIDLCHGPDLLCLLFFVFLIDIDSIDPYDLSDEAMLKL